MDCGKCGASVQTGTGLCPYCGNQLTISHPPKTPQRDSTQGKYCNGVYATVSAIPGFNFLKPYFQDEFNKIDESNEKYKGKWNWPAFLFSVLWFATKGIWLPFVVFIVVEVIVLLIGMGVIDSLRFIEVVNNVGGLGVCIFSGFRGNYFYFKKFARGE